MPVLEGSTIFGHVPKIYQLSFTTWRFLSLSRTNPKTEPRYINDRSSRPKRNSRTHPNQQGKLNSAPKLLLRRKLSIHCWEATKPSCEFCILLLLCLFRNISNLKHGYKTLHTTKLKMHLHIIFKLRACWSIYLCIFLGRRGKFTNNVIKILFHYGQVCD